jgi:FkbM family methyltransferase
VILVDVGAHRGEILQEVLKPRYSFSQIYCIEPSSKGLRWLKRYKDQRLGIESWGAWSSNGEMKLFSAGSVGGSVFEDKNQVSDVLETIQVRNFGDWLESLDLSQDVYIKVNVEGAELEILKSLVGKKILQHIRSILLSPDILKVPSLQNAELELWELVKTLNIKVVSRQSSEPTEAVRLWLTSQNLGNHSYSAYAWIEYYLQLPKFVIARNLTRHLIPRNWWLWLAYKFGPDRHR